MASFSPPSKLFPPFMATVSWTRFVAIMQAVSPLQVMVTVWPSSFIPSSRLQTRLRRTQPRSTYAITIDLYNSCILTLFLHEWRLDPLTMDAILSSRGLGDSQA